MTKIQKAPLKHSAPSMPRHVAIIMDGNGRWATSKGKSRLEGHRAGTNNIKSIIYSFVKYGVEFLTLYAFSTENWKRPSNEVRHLNMILNEVISKESENLHREGVRIRHIGQMDRLTIKLQKKIRASVEKTQNNSKLTLTVAFNYGGRAEIIDAVKAIIRSGLAPERVTDEVFSQFLYTHDTPDPDLIIRTAGEMRLSNFLIWQSAYAEYYTTSVFWPDFGEEEVDEALIAFGKRNRRYGQVTNRYKSLKS